MIRRESANSRSRCCVVHWSTQGSSVTELGRKRSTATQPHITQQVYGAPSPRSLLSVTKTNESITNAPLRTMFTCSCSSAVRDSVSYLVLSCHRCSLAQGNAPTAVHRTMAAFPSVRYSNCISQNSRPVSMLQSTALAAFSRIHKLVSVMISQDIVNRCVIMWWQFDLPPCHRSKHEHYE